MLGVVSNLIPAKKYGFISGENGQEYFFHMTDMISSWEELIIDFRNSGGGRIKVEFEPNKTSKGPRARNVSAIEGD